MPWTLLLGRGYELPDPLVAVTFDDGEPSARHDSSDGFPPIRGWRNLLGSLTEHNVNEEEVAWISSSSRPWR
jgi:hypothetical protein